MKILVTCSWYLPHVVGGAETLVHQACSALSKEHEVTVYCRNNSNADCVDLIGKIKVVRQRYKQPKIRLFKRLTEFFQDTRNGMRIPGDYDLAISCSFGYSIAVKRKFPYLRSIFMVMAFVNTLVDPSEPNIGFTERLCRMIDYHLFRYIERKAFVKTDKLFLASQSSYDHLKQEYAMDYSKVVIMPYGIDLDRFSAKRDRSILKRFNISEDKFVILAVSRLVKLKNVQLLVKSMKYIDGAFCLIVGDGPEKSSLQKLAMDLGIADKVVFAGEVKDAWSYFAAADVFAHPSMKELFGTVTVEAMASGVPCIALKKNIRAGIIVPSDEMITKDVGFCVENNEIALAEAINVLKRDSSLRQAMALNARRKAEHCYNVDRWAEKVAVLKTEMS